MDPVLQYSCCNEDTRSELEALSVADRRVVSIAAAGGRALSLLLGDPKEVVAIDRNPAQLYLGELVVAGMKALGRAEYLAFVGHAPSTQRLSTFRALEGALSAAARGWWNRRLPAIESGLLHSGRCEQGIARVAPLFRTFLGSKVAAARASTSLEAQADIARRLLQSLPVRALFKAIFNPISGKYVLKDPVYYGEGRRSAGAYLQERILETLENHRFDDCFVLTLFWNGNLEGSSALPEYLTEEGYELVRGRLDRVRFVESDIIEFLSRESAASVDAFSLSDLGGYLTTDQFSELLTQVQRVASPGARVCIREYISEPTARARWPGALSRNRQLEAKLRKTDRSVGCTFVCAQKEAA
jgi:S-adenosylmethionine-diacylglycerol 3-amino-3-carboxypropyl transferase